MSLSTPSQLPQVEPWDPQQEDVGLQHGVYKGQPGVGKPAQWPTPETPQQLHAAGWKDCQHCHDYWLSPENAAVAESRGGYWMCPKCKTNNDLLAHLPWHGAAEEDYYPKGNTGGGTAIGLPMDDVGQIAENVVQGMKEIPGYGPIVWWHGSATDKSPLDGATKEWGIEVKGVVYDAANHKWHPGSGKEIEDKHGQAQEMGLLGILGVMVLENFRTDTADVYVKEMPLTPRMVRGRPMSGAVQWYKRTGVRVATDIPFTNPLKDPHNPAPGPYSMESYYQRPMPLDYQPSEPAPF